MKRYRNYLLEVIGVILAIILLYTGIQAGVGLGQHMAEPRHPILPFDR